MYDPILVANYVSELMSEPGLSECPMALALIRADVLEIKLEYGSKLRTLPSNPDALLQPVDMLGEPEIA